MLVVCGCVSVWVCKSAVNIHSYSLATLVRASPVHSYGGGARVCVMGGLPPLWFIEHRCAVGGRYPPRFAGRVLRRGRRGRFLSGRVRPLLVYRASLRRWGAVPPRDPRGTPAGPPELYIHYIYVFSNI